MMLMQSKSCRGASMVEFAIILPVLILILFGLIEFSLLLFNKQVITNATREGARLGIIAGTPRQTDEQIITAVTRYTGSNLITFGPKTLPDIEITRTGILFGDDLTVQTTYHYDFLILPNFASSLIGGIDLFSQATMKYE